MPDENSTFHNKLLIILLTLASVCFVVGVFLPMLTLTKFYFSENSFSIVSGIIEMAQRGQILLLLIIASFSIVIPIAKIYVLFNLLLVRPNSKTQRILHLMHEYGRWAMLDVLVVAVLVVTVKLKAIASIEVEPGLYVFASAVLLIMYVTHQVVKIHESTTNSQQDVTNS